MSTARLQPLFTIDPVQLRALLHDLLQETPPFEPQQPITDLEQRWLSRASALVEASGDLSDTVAFRTARSKLNSYTHDRTALLAPVYNAFQRADLHCPADSQGRFIAPEDTWNGYAALVRLFQTPCETMLVVDPYLGASLFLELLPHSRASKGVRCLTSGAADKAGLVAAHGKWQAERPEGTPAVDLRFAPKGALHDRLIFIDSSHVWLVSQSLKDIVKRSPASLVQADAEIGSFKRDHYESVWAESGGA